MMKKRTNWAVLIYGLFILILGYLGYQRSESLISLYAGVGFGTLLILTSILMVFKPRFGAYAALFLTLALTGTFAVRYSITTKGIPAILAVISGGMLLYLLVQIVKWKR